MNTIDGVWMNNPCDFDTARAAAANPASFVMISRGFGNGGCFRHDTDAAHESCMASFLTWVRPGMYFSCVDPSSDYANLGDNCINGVKPNTTNPDGGGLPPWFPAYERRLGTALGAAKQTTNATTWIRRFHHHDFKKGVDTVVTYDETRRTGQIQWADGKPPQPRINWTEPA